MKMKLTILALALLSVTGSIHAYELVEAAEPPSTSFGVIYSRISLRNGAKPGSEITIANSNLGSEIKNAPYRADIIIENVITLPDGNQISNKTLRRSFRDGAGRTRQEMLDDKGAVTYVHIADTVEAAMYMLIPEQKLATRFAGESGAKKSAGDSKSPTENKGPLQVEITGVEKSRNPPANSPTFVVNNDLQVKLNIGGTLEGYPQVALLQHAMVLNNKDSKWSSNSATTMLGSRDFDGVKADGVSISYTIPAGAVGNKNPLTITSESWYSVALHMTLYIKKNDPRTGENLYRVTNIKLGEPPKSLFTVPADYKFAEAEQTPIRIIKNNSK